jgi:long-chain acyl-CoA synthetase
MKVASHPQPPVDDLWTILLRFAESRPDHPAVITGNQHISYARLRAQALSIAAGLAGRGVEPGDAVLLALGNVPEFVAGFLAIIYLGAVAVPISPTATAGEMATHATLAAARIGLFSDRRTAEAMGGDSFLAVPVEGAGGSIRDWIEHGLSHGERPLTSSPDVLALVQPSSGSMGRPKLAERTHGQLVAEARALSRTANLGGDERILATVPLFHCHGLGNCLLAAIYHGAALVLLERFEPHAAVAALIDQRITVFPGVPFLFGILAESGVQGRFPDLRLCFSAGGPLPEETYRAFKAKFGVGIRQLYGCTEAGAITINLDADLDPSWQTVGRPLCGMELRVVDDRFRDVPDGGVGEVAIRGGGLMRGYRNVVRTDVFRDGYFLTGDLGRLDDRGRLTITGRRKLFINVGGTKVDPVEVEEVVRAHADVEDVVVVGEPTRFGDERVKAAVVASRQMKPWEIVEHCRARLSAHKVPKIVVFRDAIPRSPLGKILRGKV